MVGWTRHRIWCGVWPVEFESVECPECVQGEGEPPPQDVALR